VALGIDSQEWQPLVERIAKTNYTQGKADFVPDHVIPKLVLEVFD